MPGSPSSPTHSCAPGPRAAQAWLPGSARSTPHRSGPWTAAPGGARSCAAGSGGRAAEGGSSGGQQWVGAGRPLRAPARQLQPALPSGPALSPAQAACPPAVVCPDQPHDGRLLQQDRHRRLVQQRAHQGSQQDAGAKTHTDDVCSGSSDARRAGCTQHNRQALLHQQMGGLAGIWAGVSQKGPGPGRAAPGSAPASTARHAAPAPPLRRPSGSPWWSGGWGRWQLRGGQW